MPQVEAEKETLQEELDEMKRQRDSESKARELAKFMAQQEKEENGDMKGQLGSANAEILRLREQCDKLTLSIREHKEASQKANTAMAKEKERRREAERHPS